MRPELLALQSLLGFGSVGGWAALLAGRWL
jgi:hypothetical protein